MKIFHPEARSKSGIRLAAFSSTSKHVTPVHMHSGVELVYVHSGAGTTEIGGITYPITKGTVCIIPEGLTHVYSTERPFLFYNILFGFDVFSADEQKAVRALPKIDSLFFDTTRSGIRILSLIPGFHRIFEDTACELINELKEPDAFTAARSTALLKELLIIAGRAALSPQKPLPEQPSGAFINMLGFIHEHYTEKVTLAAAAAAGGLSEKYAGIVFKKSAGISLVDYLNTLRIENAMQLLARSDLPVSDIAFRSGFDDASYFSLQFKRYAKVTPRAYREAVIKKSL